jgi:hypothetical protein
VSILFYLLFTLISPNLLTALIGSVGLMIAFYYGLTGIACAWFYRKHLTVSVRDFLMRGLVPLAGGVTLTAVFVYGLIQYAKPDWLTDDEGNNVTILGYGAVAVVGIGALALGVVAMVAWWIAAPPFFHGLTLSRRSSADLILEPATAVEPTLGLPDSGDMPTVIAPDLSNLPPGETAVNPETGEEFTRR